MQAFPRKRGYQAYAVLSESVHDQMAHSLCFPELLVRSNHFSSHSLRRGVACFPTWTVFRREYLPEQAILGQKSCGDFHCSAKMVSEIGPFGIKQDVGTATPFQKSQSQYTAGDDDLANT